ncbi:MAG: sigma-70 family RNA polymerase sigma factor [Erysipelotrichales bacterium]|nr:sigma-70 family RNA polymerase sigma factor [Erysipelotrichales bacterium]
MQEYSDHELLYMIRQQTPRCYEMLFEKYEKLIWRLIHKIHFAVSEQEEAYHIAVQCFQVSVEGYQEKRGTQFGTYFYSVLEKTLLIYRRKVHTDEIYKDSLDSFFEREDPTCYERLMGSGSKVRDASEMVHMMYKECDHKEKEIIELFLQGYTRKEIGSIMNISRYKVQHSFRKIRQKYESLVENKPFD